MKLSILVGVDSFAFLICDTHGQVFFQRQYDKSANDERQTPFDQWIWQRIMDDDYLKRPFNSTGISIVNQGITLVPTMAYDPVYKNDYFESAAVLHPKYTVKTDELPAAQAMLLYSGNQVFVDIFSQYFPKATYYHSATPKLRFWLENPAPNNPTGYPFATAHFYKSFVQVFVFDKHHQLLLANSFSYKFPQDALYYILHALEQLELPTYTACYCSGRIEMDGKLMALLQEYLIGFHLAKAPSGLTFGPGFDFHPKHTSLDLYTLAVLP